VVDSGSVVFDRYRIEQRIGVGGMGVVWRAVDLLLDQSVALKRVSLVGVEDQQAELIRQRALREARLAARLRHHRHVVATYDVRIDDGDVWLVLEYLPSRSLAQILDERGPLDPGQVARIGAQVADALAAAHALGIEHRDITPGNVLITDDGAVKLTDFGISHLAGDTQLTQTGAISGTFAYLAPEVAQTGKSSPASDVFSLGSTLYAAIEGQPPFGTAENALQLLSIVRVGIIRPPTAAGEFTPLLMRLLELNPVTRPDAATARDKLDEFATRVNASTDDLQTTSAPLRRWSSRYPVLTVALALITLVTVVVGTLVVIGGGQNAPVAGTPALPPTVGPIALTGDPKAADPCALIDPVPLRQFGQPFITTSYRLQGCRARIATPNGDILFNVLFGPPASSVADLGGTPQQLGDLTIIREGTVSGTFETNCGNTLVLADRTQIFIEAYGPVPDLCAVAEVGTAVAVNALARNGISYRPDRTSGWLLANSNACEVLDPAARSKVPGLDSTIRFPGFANWSCTWGASSNGSPRVSVGFRLDDRIYEDEYGDPTIIAGRRAWLHTHAGDNNPQQCMAFVVHRLAPSATAPTEIIQVTVDAPGSREDLCARATELATAAVANLPAP
jgi:eukaryotic-like serine/threonine-protein kinase